MTPRMEVEVPIGSDGLRRTVWRFWYDERVHALVLHDHMDQTRQSRRHKWQTASHYNRIGGGRGSSRQAPEVPALVKRMAWDQYAKALVVGHEDEVRAFRAAERSA